MEERGVNVKGSVSVSGLISVVMADLAPLFVCLVWARSSPGALFQWTPISVPTATLAPFQRSCLNKWPPLWPRTLRTVSPLRKKSEPERESENNCLGLHVVTVYWCVPQVALILCIVENFRGRNFHKFWGFVAICESFLHKVWWRGVFLCGTSEQFVKFFSPKIVFFTNL